MEMRPIPAFLKTVFYAVLPTIVACRSVGESGGSAASEGAAIDMGSSVRLIRKE